MAADQGRSFAGQRLDDADFSEARLHGVDFTRTRITDGLLVDADICGDITGLRVNGVEVAPLVEEELDRRHPERRKLRATDPAGIAEGWAIIEGAWNETVRRARRLPEPLLFQSVDDEWSLVETLRHLIFATDCWHGRMIRQERRPCHPWGLAGSFLGDPAAVGLDPAATPTFDEVLEVRRGRMAMVGETVATLTPEELARVCEPPAAPGHPNEPESVLTCLRVILEEEWWHCRYANRDLDVLSAPTTPQR
jgi:hypothetical protein